MSKSGKCHVILVSLYNREFALGVRYLSKVLRSHGHRCDIIFFKQMVSSSDPSLSLELVNNSNFINNHTVKDMESLTDLISSLKPDILGISVISSFFNLAVEITEHVKAVSGLPVIWGGMHPTLMPDESIAHADILCIGEGEDALLELSDALCSGKDYSSIGSLWVKGRDGRIVKNDPRMLVTDLDSFGFPDFDDDEFKHYIDDGIYSQNLPDKTEHNKNKYNIMTSRGCPFKCTYCCGHIFRDRYKGRGPVIRRRSVKSIIDEIVAILEKNSSINYIHFWDDIFTFDKKWISEFTAAYKKAVNLPFVCYAHPDYTDPEILKLLRDSNLQSVNLGIQSGSDRICRDYYGRVSDNNKVAGIALNLKELGIVPYYDLLVDNPYEKDEDYRKTLDLLLSLPRPFELNLHSLCYFPETAFTKRALADGKITQEQVEGKNNKAVNHFRMSLEKERSRMSLYWNILIGMTRHDFFSVNLIRSISRSGLLRRYPVFLKTAVVTVLKYKKIKSSWNLRQKPGFTEAVKISLINHQKIDGMLKVELKITGKKRMNDIIFGLRIFPFQDPVYPERYLGAWNLFLNIPHGEMKLSIEIRLPLIEFIADSNKIESHESWVGKFNEPGLYYFDCILHSKNGEVLTNLLLPLHSYNIV